MSKKDGLKKVLAGILSEDDPTTRPIIVPGQQGPTVETATPATPVPPERPEAAPALRAEAPEPTPQAASKAVNEPIRTIKARRGRPPGQKSDQKAPKSKTSLSLDAALYQRYIKRSYREECQVGELIERALLDYEKRKWGTERPGTTETAGTE